MENKRYKLPLEAKMIWRIQSFFAYLLIVIIAILIISFIDINWLTHPTVHLLGFLFLTFIIADFLFLIPLRQKYFSYELNDKFIIIRNGKFIKRQKWIPIEKIYYLGQKDGPILRKYNLIDVDLGTVVRPFEIPFLTEKEFKQLEKKVGIKKEDEVD